MPFLIVQLRPTSQSPTPSNRICKLLYRTKIPDVPCFYMHIFEDMSYALPEAAEALHLIWARSVSVKRLEVRSARLGSGGAHRWQGLYALVVRWMRSWDEEEGERDRWFIPVCRVEGIRQPVVYLKVQLDFVKVKGANVNFFLIVCFWNVNWWWCFNLASEKEPNDKNKETKGLGWLNRHLPIRLP